MAFANIYIDTVGPTTATDLEVRYIATNSAGKVLPNGVLSFPGTGRAISQLFSALKAQVIAWAATVPGGSIVLGPQDVWIADDQITGVRVAADQATSNPAFIDVPGMQFPLAPSSHYKFSYTGAYTTAAATTGLQLSVNGPASPLFMRAVCMIATAVGTPFYGAIGAYDAPVAALNSGGATALPFKLEGTISTNAAGGAFTLRFRTEVNGSAVTILRGSFGELVAVN